jgi:hypothetical protein
MTSNELIQILGPSWAPYDSPSNIAALQKAAEARSRDHYVLNSETTLRIVFNQLVKDHGIKPNPNYRAPITPEFRNLVERQLSPTELRIKLERDDPPGFRAMYEQYASEPAPAAQPVELTAQMYNAIPASIAARKYQSDPEFRKAVDRLFETGAVRSTNFTVPR